MKPSTMLTVSSLLCVLLLSAHLTGDVVLGLDRGAFSVVGVLIPALYLCGTLLLPGRRAGWVIMLIGGLISAVMPVIHMRGKGISGIVDKPGAFPYIWTMMLLGALGTLSVILAANELWKSRPRRA